MQEEAVFERDTLTGLLSRKGLEKCLSSYDAEGFDDLVLLTVQITRFGNVNCSIGDELGDKIITLVSKRLEKTFTDAAAIARTHGDYFCLLYDNSIRLTEILEKLQDFTQRPFALRGQIVVLSVRIGVAQVQDNLLSPNMLLQASEVALQHAKQHKLKTVSFQPDMLAQAKGMHDTENALRVSLVNRHAELHRAMYNEEFVLYYQPIMQTSTGAVVAFEALLRWQHPERGLIPPAQFIPIAEEIQVMDVLGSWVIQRAMVDAITWAPNIHGKPIDVSVNVSATQFIEPNILIDAVKTGLQSTLIDPKRVKLEITESSDFSLSMRDALFSLRNLGCQISLDDFGTGFSSLTQLNLLPLDYFKLDRSFVKDLDADDSQIAARSIRMTQAVLSLAETFDITPVIEGVETEKQYLKVRELGADLIQGYYFAKPMPAAEVNDYILSLRGKHSE